MMRGGTTTLRRSARQALKEEENSFEEQESSSPAEQSNASQEDSPESSQRSYQHQDWQSNEDQRDSEQDEDSYDQYRDMNANIGLKGKDEAENEADSVSGGHVSDGVNFDEIDEEMNRAVQVEQRNSNNPEEHEGKRRQASLAGQKRVHKVCQRERRRTKRDGSSQSQEDDDDFLDDSDSSQSAQNARRQKPNAGKMHQDQDLLLGSSSEDGFDNYGQRGNAGAQSGTRWPGQSSGNEFKDQLKKLNLHNYDEKRAKGSNGRRSAATAKRARLDHVQSKIDDDQKELEQEQKEVARQREDEKVRGCFEFFEPRELKALIGYEEIIGRKQNSKFVELMCLVSWWPNQTDPFNTPMDSEVSYNELRQKAPRLVIDYFIKRTILE